MLERLQVFFLNHSSKPTVDLPGLVVLNGGTVLGGQESIKLKQFFQCVVSIGQCWLVR